MARAGVEPGLSGGEAGMRGPVFPGVLPLDDRAVYPPHCGAGSIWWCYSGVPSYTGRPVFVMTSEITFWYEALHFRSAS
jgi:hypothetical protein